MRLQNEPNFDNNRVQCMKCGHIQDKYPNDRYVCKKCGHKFYRFPKEEN